MVLTQHNDSARTGVNPDEKLLNRAGVRSATFGRLWTLYADGQVVAQPLYVSGLAIDTGSNPNAPLVRGTFNAVIVATMHNTVYAYDADNAKPGPDGRTVPLWATWLGPPRPGGKDIDMFSTNDPEWGILGTPVISDDRKTVYVVAWHDDGAQGFRYRLHALDLASGAERQAGRRDLAVVHRPLAAMQTAECVQSMHAEATDGAAAQPTACSISASAATAAAAPVSPSMPRP